jgi:hypothetical protein
VTATRKLTLAGAVFGLVICLTASWPLDAELIPLALWLVSLGALAGSVIDLYQGRGLLHEMLDADQRTEVCDVVDHHHVRICEPDERWPIDWATKGWFE